MRCEDGEHIHGVPIRKDYVKVSIKKVLDGEKNTPLPVPFFGHELLGDEVEGSWAQWPSGKIKLHQEEELSQQKETHRIEKKKEKVKRKKHDKGEKITDLASGVVSPNKLNEDELPFLINKDIEADLPKSCKELYYLYKNQKSDFCIDVDFLDDIFYYPEKANFTAFIIGEDLKHLLTLGWLNTGCIHIWISFLHKEAMANNLQEVVGFLSPSRLGAAVYSPQKLRNYLIHSLSKQHKKQYILAPFNENRHWMLIVIMMQRGTAYFFNSLGGGLENMKVKGALSMAYRTLKLSNGFRKSFDWVEVKCSRQPGGFECGYYVLKYMDEVFSLVLEKQNAINDGQQLKMEEHFTLKPYAQEQIDDVRERWCRYFIDHCL